jgi:N-acetylglucosaminyldiphosphoundecaprenol N-acetyl-beta-D-mannosaminyltransferase
VSDRVIDALALQNLCDQYVRRAGGIERSCSRVSGGNTNGAPPELLVVPCAGVPITACPPDQAADHLVELALTSDRGHDVHLCNAYTLALADGDDAYRAMLGRASINFPDGAPVVWANRLRHRHKHIPVDRVRGPGLFLDVFGRGQSRGLKHYLLGGEPAVLAALQANLHRQFPDAEIVGAESPPFRVLTEAERDDQADRIRASGAQIVWVGLGTPKQDWECARLRDRLPCVFVAIGAAFDFAAGTKSTAPAWMQHNGLEWLHRFASEPRRLWRRYLFGNSRFVLAAIRRR